MTDEDSSGRQIQSPGSSGPRTGEPGASGTKPNKDELASGLETFLLVSALLLAFVSTVLVLLVFWPSADASQVARSSMRFAGIPMNAVSEEGRWFVLVMAAGALGSFVHAASSAVDFIGNGVLVKRWIAWYLLRLPIGASLALLIYLLLRGGVLTGMQLEVPKGQQPYGIIGLSALAGMFAEKATRKLSEVFETLFKPSTPDLRKDKLDGVDLVLERIDPNPLTTAAVETTIKLIGRNFRKTSRVIFSDGSKPRRPIFVSDTELRLKLTPADVESAREVDISVESPDGSQTTSTAITLVIQAPTKPSTGEG